MATGSTMPKQSLEVQKESEKRKAELISIEIRCGTHELPLRYKGGTPHFKGLSRIYRSKTEFFERNALRPLSGGSEVEERDQAGG